MLGAMFSGRHKLRTDDNGRAYLDRSAKHFDYILDYLGSLPAPPDSNQELERVRAGTRLVSVCVCGYVFLSVKGSLSRRPPFSNRSGRWAS